MFRLAVTNAPTELQPVLKLLLNLQGLYNIQENSGLFLASGFLQGPHLTLIREQILSLYERLRPDCITLVDSFNLSDFIINSPMGRYDGDIWNSYYSQIKAANPPVPHKYFEKVLKPMVFIPDTVYEDLTMDD